MAPDPLSVAGVVLSSVGLVAQAVDGCHKIYGSYRLTRCFGPDFNKAEKQLGRLLAKYERLVGQHPKYMPFDVSDELDPVRQEVVSTLVAICTAFEQCKDIIEKYEKKANKAKLESAADEGDGQETTEQASVSEPRLKQLRWSLLKARFKKNKKQQGKNDAVFSESSTVHESSVKCQSETDDPQSLSDSPGLDADTTIHETVSGRNTDSLQPPESVIESMSGSVEQRVRQDEADSISRQKRSTFTGFIKWLDHDKKNLETHLQNLRLDIQELEILLAPRVPANPTHHVNPAAVLDEMSQIPAMTSQIRRSMKRLHDAISNSNRVVANRMYFAIKVIEDPSEAAQLMADEDHGIQVCGNGDSFLSVLQAHSSEALTDSSRLLLTETMSSGNHPAEGHLETITDIGGALKSESSDLGGYQNLGVLSHGNPRNESHAVFSCHPDSWKTRKTLSDWLKQDEFQVRLNRAERLQVARLATLSFLYFQPVSAATGIQPRPSFVRYYQKDTDTQGWMSASTASNPCPVVLTPYLSIGFGTKRRTDFAQGGGLSLRTTSPLVELGLVLYQIGSSRVLDYGSGLDGVRRAKAEALRHLKDVCKLLGATFGEQVKACLEWKGCLAASPTEPASFEYLEGIWAWLLREEDILPNSYRQVGPSRLSFGHIAT